MYKQRGVNLCRLFRVYFDYGIINELVCAYQSKIDDKRAGKKPTRNKFLYNSMLFYVFEKQLDNTDVEFPDGRVVPFKDVKNIK